MLGGRPKIKSARLTGHETSPTGPYGNFGNNPKSMTRKKPSFEELLHKYQKIAKEKLINQLEGNQRRNSSWPQTNKK